MFKDFERKSWRNIIQNDKINFIRPKEIIKFPDQFNLFFKPLRPVKPSRQQDAKIKIAQRLEAILSPAPEQVERQDVFIT